VISVWGIIQFALLGIFFFVQAAPLLDDFDFDHHVADQKTFDTRLKDAFHQRAYNCWIAAILYVILLVFTGTQFMTNLKRSSTPAYPTSITSPFTGVITENNGVDQPYGMQYNTDQH
jgi:ribonuclease kappa